MIISFDFDDTLCFSHDDSPCINIVSILKLYYEMGNECHIVTAREDTLENAAFIKSFIDEHKLPVKAVHLNDNTPKGPKLKELGVLVHYDDDFSQCSSASQHGINWCYVLGDRVVDTNMKKLK